MHGTVRMGCMAKQRPQAASELLLAMALRAQLLPLPALQCSGSSHRSRAVPSCVCGMPRQPHGICGTVGTGPPRNSSPLLFAPLFPDPFSALCFRHHASSRRPCTQSRVLRPPPTSSLVHAKRKAAKARPQMVPVSHFSLCPEGCNVLARSGVAATIRTGR